MRRRRRGLDQTLYESELIEAVAVDVLSGERELVTTKAGLEDIAAEPLPIAAHAVGKYGAVRLLIRHSARDYANSICDEVVFCGCFHDTEPDRWSVICSGGSGGSDDPAEFWAVPGFQIHGKTATAVGDDGSDSMLWAVRGHTSSGYVEGTLGSQTLGRIAVAEHGLFVFVAVIAQDDEASVSPVGDATA